MDRIEKAKDYLYYLGKKHDALDDALADCVDKETGEIVDNPLTIEDALSKLQGTATEVVAMAGSMIMEINAEIEDWEDAEKRAKANKDNLKGKLAKLKDATLNYMDKTGIKSISGKVNVSTRSSKAVSIDNEAELPEEYWRIKYEPDKTAISKAIKSGQDVPGASLQTNRSLIIK